MAREKTPPASKTSQDGTSELRVTGLIQRTLEFKQKYEVMEAFPEPEAPAPEPEEANTDYRFKVMDAPAPRTKAAPTLSDMNK